MIDSAVDQYAIETNRATGATVGVADWTSLPEAGPCLYNTGQDLFGDDYGAQTVDSLPTGPARRLEYLVGRGWHGLLLTLRSLERRFISLPSPKAFRGWQVMS